MQIVIILLIFTILISFTIFSLLFSWWRKNIPYEYPRVLMYHMVSKHLPKNKSKFNRLRVEPKEFEKQIKWLSKNGFKSYFVREISDDLSPKSVIITFDDGYKDNLTNALPILQKYGFKATIFIVCNRFDNNWATDKDLKKSSDELNSEEMLGDNDVKELLESGFIEIGSHALNHANLPSLSYKDKQNEILNSKLEIEKKFGITCESFAYPFGFYDEESMQLAKESGYKFSVTTNNDVLKNRYSNYEIPRIMISGRGNILHFILKIKKGRSR